MKYLILALLLLAPLAAQASGQDGTGHEAADRRAFQDPAERAKTWDSKERNAWQHPEVVMRILGLELGHVVADIGCGTGYFTRLLSTVVGSGGVVYAVDVDQAMLDHLSGRDDIFIPDNIVTVLADPDDPQLPKGKLDLIFTSNTWHHIDARLEYLARLEQALKPAGRLVIIDWREGELPEGPPPGHKLDRDLVVRELQEGGWTLTSESVALPYQYFLIFEAPRRAD